jgi:hypothetical protein
LPYCPEVTVLLPVVEIVLLPDDDTDELAVMLAVLLPVLLTVEVRVVVGG